MPTIKFSASASATAATSITVPFGGSPAVGDLVVVFLLVDNEIITHPPGWASEFTATPNPWFKLDAFRAPDSSTLSGWYHTWNASDSGTSATFTFVPAPTLGIGDKDVSTANAVASAVVFDGANSTAILEHNIYGTAQDLVYGTPYNDGPTITASPLKLASAMSLHAFAVNGSAAGPQDRDGLATEIAGIGSGGSTGRIIGVFQRLSPPTRYAPTFYLAGITPSVSPMVLSVTVSDNLPQLYNSPFIEEAPMGMNALMARYRMNRYFTVLNNAGTFSAQRYQSTDQIAAATQVFVNNQPISTTDRANILASGVGGDFLAVS